MGNEKLFVLLSTHKTSPPRLTDKVTIAEMSHGMVDAGKR